MSENIHVQSQIVDINSLKSFPKNPRRGDVEAIAQSLEKNGQYKPIVVNKRNNTILTGNHTWRAARSLGWTEIAVSFVDVDELGAQKIVLADNRTSDMSSYDDFKLLELLETLPDYEGTGFTQVDVEQLQSILNSTDLFEPPNKGRSGQIGETVRVCVGTYRILVDDDEYKNWADDLIASYKTDEAIMEELKSRLSLSNVKAVPPVSRIKNSKKSKAVTSKQSMHSVIASTENVNINSVFPYPMNARHGDIGMIAESLKANGQFRPIVVNKRDNSILVGNHTWKAAKALGWKEIGVTFVDVDEEAAARIVLVDNKLSDLGSYDHIALAEILQSMPSFDGTGYDGDDLDELMKEVAGWGIKSKPTKEVENSKPRNVTAIVGKWEIKMEQHYFDKWEEEAFVAFGYSYDEVCAGIIEMLKIPSDAWVSTKQRDSKRKSARRSQGE